MHNPHTEQSQIHFDVWEDEDARDVVTQTNNHIHAIDGSDANGGMRTSTCEGVDTYTLKPVMAP